MKWNLLSWFSKFLWINTIYILLNISTSLVYFLDNYSIVYQIVYSLLHLGFFVLLMKSVYLPYKEIKIKKEYEVWWILGFVILNLIPFSQGYELAENGFVPIWAILPQIKFGLPFTYLRWFITDSDYTHLKEGNPLLHLNELFLNLYFWGNVTLIFLAINLRLVRKRK
ncbi:MAG: hypothetical protein R2879_07570 [Saprospiraceae bacterium]